MQLHEVVNQAQAKRAELEVFIKETKEKKLALEAEIQRLELLQQAAGQNVSIEDIEIASKILWIDGSMDGNSARREVVFDAVADIAAGCPKLMHEFFATKNYASFYDQRSDHPYGYGPKHGHIVFRIELKRNVRDALMNNDQGSPPTKEQFDACIRVLLAFADGRVNSKLFGSIR